MHTLAPRPCCNNKVTQRGIAPDRVGSGAKFFAKTHINSNGGAVVEWQSQIRKKQGG